MIVQSKKLSNLSEIEIMLLLPAFPLPGGNDLTLWRSMQTAFSIWIRVSESAKNKRPQKKIDLENQDLGQPKSKIVNKPVYTEETTDEDSDQQEEIQNMTQNAMPVQKEGIESNPPNQPQNEDEETNEDQVNEPPKIPVKRTVKWEKKTAERRASERTTKKPDRW